jgi:hypothetical protein
MRWLSLLCLVACGEPAFEDFVFEAGELDQAGPPTAIDNTLVLDAPLAAAKDGVAYLRVSGAAPGQTVRIAGSYVGTGNSGFCPVWLNRNCVDLQTVGRVASAVADANGEATIVYDVPDTPEDRVYLQALGRRDAATRLLPNKSGTVSVRLDDLTEPVDRILMSYGSGIFSYTNPGGVQTQLVNVLPQGFIGMNDFAVGPDDNVYVSVSGRVIRYDGTTGAYIDDFVPDGTQGLGSAQALSFGPDGNLYVASNSTSQILRFDGQTGDFIDVFSDVTRLITSMAWADGDLYVASNTRVVLHLDGITGDELELFFIGLNGSLDIAYAQGTWVLTATTASTARYYDSDWNVISDVGTQYATSWGAFIQGGELFIADPGFDRIWVYNFGTGSVLRSFTAPGGSQGYGMQSR